MKIGAAVLLAAMAIAIPHAAGQSSQSHQGTIVAVKKMDVADPAVRAGASADRTPLRTHYTAYEISVQVKCDVYVGRYESELDDLPNTLASGSAVPVRLQKRTMYLDFPGETIKMTSVRHTTAQDQRSCEEKTAAK